MDGSVRVKLILPALTEAKSPLFRPIKYSLFPPLGLATLAAYLHDDDEVVLQDEHVEVLDLDVTSSSATSTWCPTPSWSPGAARIRATSATRRPSSRGEGASIPKRWTTRWRRSTDFRGATSTSSMIIFSAMRD